MTYTAYPYAPFHFSEPRRRKSVFPNISSPAFCKKHYNPRILRWRNFEIYTNDNQKLSVKFNSELAIMIIILRHII